MSFHDVRMRGFRARADVDEIVAWLDGLPLPASAEPEVVPLEDAAGRVLADDLVSAVDVPAFRRAAMDGWAVRGEETFGAAETDPLHLDVVGTSLPGQPYGGELRPGEAVRIMTGAPVPVGADAVLRAEEGEQEGRRLAVRGGVTPGRHVGPVGEDVTRGRRLLRAGRRLRPQDVGLASSVGCDTLRVRTRPTVSLLVTGTELLPAGSRPAHTRIADSNSPMLRALVERDGGHALPAELLPDDPDLLRDALATARGHVVVVTGGSSVGEEDHAPRLLASLGTLVFHGVAMRPAAPTGIGLLRDRPVFLLPGNPVSCLSAYDFFTGRFVRRAGGHGAEWPYRSQRAPLTRKIASVLGRVDYVRVRFEEDGARPLMARGASILSSTTEADGFVVVPRDSEGWDVGAEVEVWAYDL